MWNLKNQRTPKHRKIKFTRELIVARGWEWGVRA